MGSGIQYSTASQGTANYESKRKGMFKKLPVTDRERSSKYFTAKKSKKLSKPKYSEETRKSTKKPSSKRKEQILQKSAQKPNNNEKIKHKKSTNSTISELLKTPISKTTSDNKPERKISSYTNKASTKDFHEDQNPKLPTKNDDKKRTSKGKNLILDQVKSLSKTLLKKTGKTTREKGSYNFKESNYSGEISQHNYSTLADKNKKYALSNNLNSPNIKRNKSKKRRKNMGNNSVYEKILHSNGGNQKKLGDLNDGVSKQLLGHKSVDLPGNEIKNNGGGFTYGSHMIN